MDSEALARKYRPRRFPDVAGQGPVAEVLYRMCLRDSLPDAMIFIGPHGTGKTSTARILAAAVNCKAEPGDPQSWPCLDCPACRSVWAVSSLDYIEIDAASNGGVEQVRGLKEQLTYASSASRTVVVLDEAHSMSRDAFNALLKVLEEPPPGVHFILVTTEPARILPTVASRCIPFRFDRLTPGVIRAWLEAVCAAEGLEAGPGLLQAIAEDADGALRDGVMALDRLARVGITDLARYRLLTGDTDYAPALVDAMVSGDHAAMYARLDSVLAVNGDFAAVGIRLVSCLRDLLVLLGGGRVAAQGEALEARTQLAARLDVARVSRAMQVLWELQTRVGRVSPRSSLELACSVCLDALRAPQAPPAASNGHSNGHGRTLSLTEMGDWQP
jgi:DNA polymerase III subunit gamma/tau